MFAHEILLSEAPYGNRISDLYCLNLTQLLTGTRPGSGDPQPCRGNDRVVEEIVFDSN